MLALVEGRDLHERKRVQLQGPVLDKKQPIRPIHSKSDINKFCTMCQLTIHDFGKDRVVDLRPKKRERQKRDNYTCLK